MSSVCGDHHQDEESDDNPFASDEFRMYEFKVRRCVRSRSHDWTDCPFAHPGEKARRRDPCRFNYSGTACADFRRGGSCPRGDGCEFAHGVFECWLHPARYRTHACKDGVTCKRKVCFFAHSPRELRFLPVSITTAAAACAYCSSVRVSTSSPTSTLMGPMSPTTLSLPTSPTSTTASYYNLDIVKSGLVVLPQLTSYKSALMELARSLKAMEIATSGNRISSTGKFNKGSSKGPREMYFSANQDHDLMNNNGGGQFPDLGWVNELVM